jgi:hypothetical protein
MCLPDYFRVFIPKMHSRKNFLDAIGKVHAISQAHVSIKSRTLKDCKGLAWTFPQGCILATGNFPYFYKI